MEITEIDFAQVGTIRVIKRPGSGYSYSGGGYCILQKVVEDIMGEPFEVAMGKLMLQTVGMSLSTFQPPPLETNNSK